RLSPVAYAQRTRRSAEAFALRCTYFGHPRSVRLQPDRDPRSRHQSITRRPQSDAEVTEKFSYKWALRSLRAPRFDVTSRVRLKPDTTNRPSVAPRKEERSAKASAERHHRY